MTFATLFMYLQTLIHLICVCGRCTVHVQDMFGMKCLQLLGQNIRLHMFLQAEVTIYGTGHYNPDNDVLLRLETMSEKEVRVGPFDKFTIIAQFFP